jgi:hypothetical protein
MLSGLTIGRKPNKSSQQSRQLGKNGQKTEQFQWPKVKVAVPAGLEPATSAFEARHSIQLSYGTAGATAKMARRPIL